MQKRRLINTILIFAVCYGIIFYNLYSWVAFQKNALLKAEQSNTQSDTPPVLNFSETSDNESVKNSSTSKSENANSEKETISETSEKLPASAEAIKGKIISKYVSPYTAPLCYDKVYMKNETDTNINIKGLLESKLSFKISKNDQPQVLILHTHATETFMEADTAYYTEDFNSRTTDNSKNMVKIGAVVAEKLNNAGIKTIHSNVQHDYPQYSGSYTRAAKTISSYLNMYPSIKVVIDLHRDAISSENFDKTKLVTEIGGKKAAQIMLVMGSGTGGVSNFPNWKENLKLALKMQQTFETKYPTLARPLSLMSKNYNQSLTNGSVLIEIGTDANTLDEAIYSAELLGNCLLELFNELG